MARPRTPITLWSQYMAARLAAMALTMFDVHANLDMARHIGRAMYMLDAKHRHRSAEHISMAFPQWSRDQIDQVTRGSFDHFVQLAIEVCHTPRLLTEQSWTRHIRLNNLDEAIGILNCGRPAIMLTGHVGNWEVLGYVLALMGYPVHAIARPIDNPLVNDWLMGIREQKGLHIITKWDATDRMLAVLESGGVLGFIADQNAGDKGLFVPFFGRLASTYKSIGLLAMQLNIPIICGYAHRIGCDFSFEVGVTDIIHPGDWVDSYDPLYTITARYSRAIEKMICLRPEQYLWMHRRWKSRPPHERRSKPMPQALRTRLEQLPWMTDELMSTLSNANT